MDGLGLASCADPRSVQKAGSMRTSDPKGKVSVKGQTSERVSPGASPMGHVVNMADGEYSEELVLGYFIWKPCQEVVWCCCCLLLSLFVVTVEYLRFRGYNDCIESLQKERQSLSQAPTWQRADAIVDQATITAFSMHSF